MAEERLRDVEAGLGAPDAAPGGDPREARSEGGRVEDGGARRSLPGVGQASQLRRLADPRLLRADREHDVHDPRLQRVRRADGGARQRRGPAQADRGEGGSETRRLAQTPPMIACAVVAGRRNHHEMEWKRAPVLPNVQNNFPQRLTAKSRRKITRCTSRATRPITVRPKPAPKPIMSV